MLLSLSLSEREAGRTFLSDQNWVLHFNLNLKLRSRLCFIERYPGGIWGPPKYRKESEENCCNVMLAPLVQFAAAHHDQLPLLQTWHSRPAQHTANNIGVQQQKVSLKWLSSRLFLVGVFLVRLVTRLVHAAANALQPSKASFLFEERKLLTPMGTSLYLIFFWTRTGNLRPIYSNEESILIELFWTRVWTLRS